MQTIVQHRIRTYDEYIVHAEKLNEQQLKIFEIEQDIVLNLGDQNTIKGFSTPAGRIVNFTFHREADGSINLRESLMCPFTNLSNRLRRSYDVFIQEACPYMQDDVYLTEQVTPFYDFLSSRYSNLVGSEYLADKCDFGAELDGIRNEDLTSLTFDTSSFDHVLSFECLEHIPNFREALKEVFRVLRPKGKFVFTVPFVHSVKDNIVRARLTENGDIEHILPAEFHGDPINNEGILCYTHFAWELLDIMRDETGFADAYAIPSWSSELGYLGLASYVFVATK